MKTEIISKDKLVEAADIFEKEVKKSDFDSVLNGDKRIYKYSGKLRNKMVFVSDHPFPVTYFKEVLPILVSIFKTGGNLSDTVNFISGTLVSRKTREEIQIMGLNEGFDVEIIDKNDLLSVEAIKGLLEVDETDGTSQFEKMAFDYLSKSNDSSFVKNGLYYSRVLFVIFQNQNITITQLQNILGDVLGKKIDSLYSDINYLKKTGKISMKKNKNDYELMLTDAETEKIQASITESQALENEFMAKFQSISQKYGIGNHLVAFDKLKSFYALRRSSLQNAEKTRKHNANQRRLDVETLYKDLTNLGCSEQRVADCVNDIASLCTQNGYLNRLSAMKSFFDLYKSNKYKEYIDHKMNVVMLDTPVFLNYLCAKSSYNYHLESTYEDDDFKVVNSLMRFRDKNQGKIKFLLPYDYASETIGELKKALQLSQFEAFASIGVPIFTSNILYNFYQYIKNESKIQISTFAEFAKGLGFQNVNLNSPRLFYDNYMFLRSFVETLGDKYVDKQFVKIDNYEFIISEYSRELLLEGKYHKTSRAIEADVRQANYLLNTARDENVEYYLTSWDSTLYILREITKERTSSRNTYAIHRPSALINRLSLKDFRIDDSSFTYEIFTYADKSYSVSDKLRNLFDNVLAPYFSAINSKNTELVKQVLKMQKAAIDNVDEGQKSKRDNRFPLEELFVNIEEEMGKNGCSQQDLRYFLSDSSNNDYFLKILNDTAEASKSDVMLDLSKQFCEVLKKYVADKDREESEEIKM